MLLLLMLLVVLLIVLLSLARRIPLQFGCSGPTIFAVGLRFMWRRLRWLRRLLLLLRCRTEQRTSVPADGRMLRWRPQQRTSVLADGQMLLRW